MNLNGIKDWFGKWFAPGSSDGSTRPDGGTNCYRPVQNKTERSGGEQARPIAYAHSGFTDMNPPSADEWGSGFTGDQAGAGYTADNISYMPGAQMAGPAGELSSTVHILPMISMSVCYKAIECMKDRETLIIPLDAIANESENTRCQDMLAGAAFTLNCQVRMLAGGKMVLIVPAGVRILPEQEKRTWADPMTYAAPEPEPRNHTAYTRERRVSRNDAGWDMTREESRSYNPYTGSMPAVSGDYSGYGGYGDGQAQTGDARYGYTDPGAGSYNTAPYGGTVPFGGTGQYGAPQYATASYDSAAYGQAAGFGGNTAVGYGQTMYGSGYGGGYDGGYRY